MAGDTLLGSASTPAGEVETDALAAPAADVPLRADGLTRRVRGRILGPFTVEVGPGELVALAGTNGSGKTTLLRLALGIDRATDGDSTIWGRRVDPMHPPTGVGYVPDRAEFWDWQTGRENLAPFTEDDEAITKVLKRTGLAAAADTRVRQYSRGMRQRLAVARALVGRPRMLVLDEPTIALDPTGVTMLVDVLSALPAKGRCALVATHDTDFLARIPARVVRVENGRMA